MTFPVDAFDSVCESVTRRILQGLERSSVPSTYSAKSGCYKTQTRPLSLWVSVSLDAEEAAVISLDVRKENGELIGIMDAVEGSGRVLLWMKLATSDDATLIGLLLSDDGPVPGFIDAACTAIARVLRAT